MKGLCMRHLHLSGLAQNADLIALRVADTGRAASPWCLRCLGRAYCRCARLICQVEESSEANTRVAVIGQAGFALTCVLEHLLALRR